MLGKVFASYQNYKWNLFFLNYCMYVFWLLKLTCTWNFLSDILRLLLIFEKFAIHSSFLLDVMIDDEVKLYLFSKYICAYYNKACEILSMNHDIVFLSKLYKIKLTPRQQQRMNNEWRKSKTFPPRGFVSRFFEETSFFLCHWSRDSSRDWSTKRNW